MSAVLLSLILVGPARAADEPLLQALALPVLADELRGAGVPSDEVIEALQATRDAGLAPAEAAELLEQADEAVEQNGRIDSFGAFVKTKLDEGLRGKDLADAIHAEHTARGMGKGEHGKPDDAGAKGGKPDDAGAKGGQPDDAGAKGGKPDDAGAKGGEPDDAGAKGGKPDDAGAKGGKGKAGGGK